MFEHRDLSLVKSYLLRQWTKILSGRVSTEDFIIAKEVKLGNYSGKGLPPPGAWLSMNRMKLDECAAPQYGERVPYVVVYNGLNSRLIDCCVSPEALIQNPFVVFLCDSNFAC